MKSINDSWLNELAAPANGEMGKRISSMDWSASPVGPSELWSSSLKSVMKTILATRYPMILLWGKELIQFYNDAYVGLIGNKHPDALGKSIKLTQAESWEAIGGMINEVMTSGTPNWVPAQALPLMRSGYLEESFFSLSYSAVHDDDGAIKGMLCVCTEVSDQIIGERRLKLLRELGSKSSSVDNVKTVCKAIIEVIAHDRMDVPFAALYLDGQLMASTGLEDQHAFNDFYEVETSGVIKNIQERMRIKGGAFNSEVHTAMVQRLNISSNEHEGILITGVSPNRALDEAYQSFIELLAGQVASALSNSFAFEAERKRSELLAELDRAKTLFFSNVSHELRTPLTLLLGPLEDALSQGKSKKLEVDRESLNSAYRNGIRLLKLVNSLLDFSRAEAGRLQANLVPVNISKTTRELASYFESALEKVQVSYKINIPEIQTKILLDKDLWEKIVLNLISNAFKFTFEGEISVSLIETTEEVELKVRDTGTGIPSEDLSKVFNRFHRVKGARSRSHEGAGIGLALVKELVQLHGGKISVESELGRGTVFTVSLPKNFTDKNEDENTEVSSSDSNLASAYVNEAILWSRKELPIEEENPGQDKPTILLVDDNADMRDYIKKLLLPHYQIISASNGKHALEQLSMELPDLILSDVMMPELDGFGLLKCVRSNEATSTLPFILISARAGQDEAVVGLEAGADDYLVKPFSAKELLARVKQNLQMARLRLSVEKEKEAVRMRDEFLSIASHELNTPLTALKLQTQLLLRNIEKPASEFPSSKVKKDVLAVDAHATRLSKLVGTLLDVSLISTGYLRLNYEEVDLVELVRNMLNRFEAQFEQLGCEMVIELPESLTGSWDPGRIEQVFENLIGNALKYAAGKPIHLSLSLLKDKVKITVTDHGTGMSQEEMSRIFGRFERGSDVRNIGGMGLGLYIVKMIVEAHGGDLVAESELGVGSTFTVELPINLLPI